MPVYRSDMGRIQVTNITGVNMDSISWDYLEGGDLTPEMQMYNPGGMAPAIAVGGLRKRSDITVRRAWSDVMFSKFIALDNASGIASVTVNFTPLNPNRKSGAGIKPITYTGILGAVTRPNYEAATSSVVYLQLVISANEAITG